MNPRLSICIPVYNFAKFIPETLESIISQDGIDEIELLVVDGASTDNTEVVIRHYQTLCSYLRYVRLPEKGGIDRDIARTVEHATGDYCWMFSGDDIMQDNALRRVLRQIESNCDLYLAKHLECTVDMTVVNEWPVLNTEREEIFDLKDRETRLRYFGLAINTEAFFSFMSGLIVRRETWNRVPLNEDFVGSCWAHAARLMELMQTGLRVKYLAAPYLNRRGDNDSFMAGGMVNRFRIAIEGYHRMADTFFGHDSVEAQHIRRVIRYEFGLGMLITAKLVCKLNPEVESKTMLDGIVRLAYGGWSFENLKMRFKYQTTPAETIRKWQPEFCARLEREINARREAARVNISA